MAKVLYVEVSPRKTSSRSITAANYFLDLYKKKYPEDTIKLFDLWKEELPDIDVNAILGIYNKIRNRNNTIEEDRAWVSILNFIDDFISFDKYLISSPLWIVGVPNKLKKLN